ncbi:flavin reductase family protein [Streptomyces sp. NPDC056069]|uniref:flavin reductase family protein n=1 Tax=Streptomyces sp. NPDC056069 TaxID=3345702 RepID=UPI0035D70C85
MTAVLHDTTSLRAVYGAFPTGVTAIAALVDGEPVGLAASSFTTVSLAPPLVSVCMAHTSGTWPVLRRADRLGLSVLGADQGALCRRLAGPAGERFAGASWQADEDGAVLLDDAAAWFTCSVDEEIRAGDHDIVVLRVHDLRLDRDVDPLVFHASSFRSLLPRPQEPR